jgi:hypothetical protein
MKEERKPCIDRIYWITHNHIHKNTLKKWKRRVLHRLKEILEDRSMKIVYKKFEGRYYNLPARREMDEEWTEKLMINMRFSKKEQSKSLIHEILHDIPKKQYHGVDFKKYPLNEEVIEFLADQLVENGLEIILDKGYGRV